MDCVHGIDAFVVREMERMSKLPKVHMPMTILIHNELSTRKSEPLVPNEIETHWRNSGVFSWVALDLINEDNIKTFSKYYLRCVARELMEWDNTRPSFDMDFIHDEFKCLPAYGNYVRQYYIDIMARIADGTVMDYILTTLRGTQVNLNKLHPNLGDLIRKGNYGLS